MLFEHMQELGLLSVLQRSAAVKSRAAAAAGRDIQTVNNISFLLMGSIHKHTSAHLVLANTCMCWLKLPQATTDGLTFPSYRA